jgi:hypothetical protein
VDTIVDAKVVLRDIDLVLQTRQVRLNSGKTQILSKNEALLHFRVFDNAKLDALSASIDQLLKSGLSTETERKDRGSRNCAWLQKQEIRYGKRREGSEEMD